MANFAQRRVMMVDTQIRPSDVTSFPIIQAFLAVPREAYVPNGLVEAAYVGENLDLGEGRVVLDPRTFAKMLDALDIQPTEMVLDLGCAHGYSAAIEARLAEAVVAVEEDEDMAREAEAMLTEHEVDNVAVVNAPLTEGAPDHGPYDVIVVQGAVEVLTDAIVSQLKDGGRVAAVFSEGTLGVVRIGYKLQGVLTWRFGFNAGAPVLRGFEQPRAFAL